MLLLHYSFICIYCITLPGALISLHTSQLKRLFLDSYRNVGAPGKMKQDSRSLICIFRKLHIISIINDNNYVTIFECHDHWENSVQCINYICTINLQSFLHWQHSPVVIHIKIRILGREDRFACPYKFLASTSITNTTVEIALHFPSWISSLLVHRKGLPVSCCHKSCVCGWGSCCSSNRCSLFYTSVQSWDYRIRLTFSMVQVWV